MSVSKTKFLRPRGGCRFRPGKRNLTMICITLLSATLLIESRVVGQEERVQKSKNGQNQQTTVEEAFPTPLAQAIVQRQYGVIKFLLSNGADPNGVDYSPYTRIPILIAADVGDPDILELLLKAGARIESKNEDGLSALMISTLRGNEKIVEFLLLRGADVNSRTGKGATALMTAARDNQLVIIRILLDAGADPNLAADGGVTALMAAGDNPETIETLLKAGARIEAKDRQGWTAVCYAKASQHHKKLASLLSHMSGNPKCDKRK